MSILGFVFGGGGAVTALVVLYKAGVEKESLAIKNLREVIEEIKSNSLEYKKETDEKIDKLEKKNDNLEKKLVDMEAKNDIKDKAIAKGIRCDYPPNDKACPVLMFMDEAEKEKRADAQTSQFGIGREY